MKPLKILIAWLLIIGQPGALFCDHIMMCTFFGVGHSEVFHVDENGIINHQYDLTLNDKSEPSQICFSPDGRWGLVGYDGYSGNPETQITTILNIDLKKIIHIQATIENAYDYLVAISPDSKYGVYGGNLQTLRYYPDTSYDVIPSSFNTYISLWYGGFSSLNGNLYTDDPYGGKIQEFRLTYDGKTTPTGVVADISPATGYKGVFVSPDGKTVIAISYIDDHVITGLKVYKEGGLSITQQFEPANSNPKHIDFTPDSKYAIISFNDSSGPNLASYSINENSELTLVHGIDLPNDPGEDMAVTPDGKYCVTRDLIRGRTYFYVASIDKDGYLTYLPDNDYDIPGFVSDIAFLPNVEPHGFMLY